MSHATQQFLQTWGVKHRLSSAYHPHSNLCAETAVKTVKRLIADNVSPTGNLNTDSFSAAILNYRNTPDRDTEMSPSHILFSRQLRDSIPTNPENLKMRSEWVLTQQAREHALARRHDSIKTKLVS